MIFQTRTSTKPRVISITFLRIYIRLETSGNIQLTLIALKAIYVPLLSQPKFYSLELMWQKDYLLNFRKKANIIQVEYSQVHRNPIISFLSLNCNNYLKNNLSNRLYQYIKRIGYVPNLRCVYLWRWNGVEASSEPEILSPLIFSYIKPLIMLCFFFSRVRRGYLTSDL